MSKIPNIPKDSPAEEAVVDDTSLKRFTFQPPIPLPMEDTHKARITLEEKGQPLKERFSFQPPIPIPIPLEGSSAMETAHKDHITLDEKRQPLEKPFSFHSIPIHSIPIPLVGTLALEASTNDHITLDGKEQLSFNFTAPTRIWQPQKERFSFRSPIPIPIPLNGGSVINDFYNAGFTLAEKEQPLKERFSFRSPIPIPLDGSSVMEDSHKARIALVEKNQFLEELFSPQLPISIPSDSSSMMQVTHNAGITLNEKRQPLKERFSFQSPISIQIPLDGSLVMKATHKAGISLLEKAQPLEESFSFQSPNPIPIPLDGSSAIEASHKVRIALVGKNQFLEELFSPQSPISIPSDSSSMMQVTHNAGIALEEKGQPHEERFSFQSPIPIPIPLIGGSAMKASYNAGITLAEKEQPLKERFSFRSPIPIPLEGSSAMEAFHKAHIALDKKEQPIEKSFNFKSPIPLHSNARMVVDALLANNRLFEAFHKARITLDEEGQSLVEHFFRHCIENNRFKVLAEFCLNEYEEQMVYRLLQQCGSRQAETVQLILLLQNNKYIEAVNFMEHLSTKLKMSDDPLTKIMLAYRSTMSPVTRGIADTYLQLNSKLDRGLAHVPNVEHRRPLSCQLAGQNPSGMKSCVFSTLLAENHHVQVPMGMHNNVPFLRTQQYGSSEMPQRLRSVRPVPYQRTVGKRHSEQKEPDEEPSSKRFRFQSPISLNLDECLPTKSAVDDAAKGNDGPEAAKKAQVDEKIPDIKEAAVAKVSPGLKSFSIGPQPSGVPHQDSPFNRRMRLRSDDNERELPVTTLQQRFPHKPRLEVIKEEEGSLDTPSLPCSHSRTGPVTPIRMVPRGGQSTSRAPNTEGSVGVRYRLRFKIITEDHAHT